MAKRKSFQKMMEEFKEIITPTISPSEYAEKYLKVSYEDLLGDYNVNRENAYATARATMMAADHEKREAERHADLAYKKLKADLERQLIYGNGSGLSQQQTHAADAARYAWSHYNEPAKETWKDPCVVLTRLLRELYINPAFSLRCGNLLSPVS